MIFSGAVRRVCYTGLLINVRSARMGTFTMKTVRLEAALPQNMSQWAHSTPRQRSVDLQRLFIRMVKGTVPCRITPRGVPLPSHRSVTSSSVRANWPTVPPCIAWLRFSSTRVVRDSIHKQRILPAVGRYAGPSKGETNKRNSQVAGGSNGREDRTH